MLKRFLKKIDQRFSIYTLCKVICVLLILFLLIKTQVVWGSWYRMLRSILQPFIIGFVLAYVMHPLVEFLEKKGIPKNFSIIAIWVCVLVFLIVMLVMLMPVLYDKINEFMTSMIDGVVWISNKIKTLGNMKDFSLVNSITNNIVNILQSYDDWVPQLVSSLPGLMNTVLNVVTNVLFSIIIAIYMLFDFERIKRGHQDWLIIGLLTSFGVIIPYLGGTIANSIGIITALTLPPSNIVALIIGIMILSNVDAYVISPLVHEKRSAMGPLITLFAVFAGGVIMGAVGIMVSVPAAIAIKTAIEVYEQKTDRKLYDNTEEPKAET